MAEVELYKTGGGKFVKKLDGLGEKVLQLSGQDCIELHNEYDSTALLDVVILEAEESPEGVIEDKIMKVSPQSENSMLYKLLNQSLKCNKPTCETEAILKATSDINAIDDEGKALLHYIAIENNIALIEIIIEKRRDLNLNILDKQSNSCTALIKSILSKNTEIAIILINAGANVNLCGWQQKTPLHHAVIQMDWEVATALLQHNANINARNLTGETPLFILCRCDIYDSEDIRCDIMLDLLLRHGADVNTFCSVLEWPLNNKVALISEAAINKLVKHKPRFDVLDSNGHSTIFFIFFAAFLNEDTILRAFEEGCCVEHRDAAGVSVLHYAVDRDYKRVAYKLLSNGFDVNCCDNTGNTAVYHVSMDKAEILYILLYYGANPNLSDDYNNSPLLNAIRSENHNLVELLFFSYEGLNGDDCHKVVDAILENPLANSLDTPTVIAMLAKFENICRSSKVEVQECSLWKIQYTYSCATVKHFLELNTKIKCNHFIEYISFRFEDYYSKLITLGVKNPCLKNDVLALVWLSLSLGIACNYSDFYRSSLIVQTVFNKELPALIWGSHSLQLLSKRYNCSGFSKLFEIYYKLLHSDIGLIRGKRLLNKLILYKNRILDFDAEDYFERDSETDSEVESDGVAESGSEIETKYNLDDESEIISRDVFLFDTEDESKDEHECESTDKHESEYKAKLLKILSFFTAEEYNRSTVMKAYSALGTTRSCYELPISVKSLAELSRDKARVFIMQTYKTKNFYQLHEAVNNLDIPNQVKRLLQFRMPVNSKMSRV